jgi:hypothetical protein
VTLLIYLVMALFFAALFFFVLNSFIGLIVGLLLGTVLAYAYTLYRQKQSPQTTARAPKVAEEHPTVRIFGNLLRLNIELRTTLHEADCIEPFESVIDQVRTLAPLLNERLPGSQMAWVINRMDTEYLPKLLRPFLALRPETRLEKKSAFLAALAQIRSELDEVETMLNSSDAEQFDSKAAFIQHRFSDLY